MADRLKAGAKLIVVDPRRTTTAEKADLFLQIRPGTDLALLNGILHLLVEDGAIDQEFIAEHTEGWEAMPRLPGRIPTGPGLRDHRTGRSRHPVAAATMIAEAGDWMTCWTVGLNQSTHGTWSANAICNLHLATGAICRPGSGPLSLTGQPNAMGGREMGYMGPGSAGSASGAVRRRPNLRRATVGAGTGHHPVRRSGQAQSTCSGNWPQRDQGRVDHLHEPCCQHAQSGHHHRRITGRGAGDHPGRLRATPRPTGTPTSCCLPRCGPRPTPSWSIPTAT